MPFFTKKPVTVEARQFLGTLESYEDIEKWVRRYGGQISPYLENISTEEKGVLLAVAGIVIVTLEDGADGRALHVGDRGDWIIKGVKGEFYFCKPDIFEETYSADEEFL